MSYHSPVEALSQSLYSACYADLPMIQYRNRDWDAHRKHMDGLSREERSALIAKETATGQVQGPFIECERRPDPRDCEVEMFLQTWSSTALGFGGVGGQAITSAYTVIVHCPNALASAVYFGGRLAYLVPSHSPHASRFATDIVAHSLASCRDAVAAYGAVSSASSLAPRPSPKMIANRIGLKIGSGEWEAFSRFVACRNDNIECDVQKEMMERIAELGLVQRQSGKLYALTAFGQSLMAESVTANAERRVVGL